MRERKLSWAIDSEGKKWFLKDRDQAFDRLNINSWVYLMAMNPDGTVFLPQTCLASPEKQVYAYQRIGELGKILDTECSSIADEADKDEKKDEEAGS